MTSTEESQLIAKDDSLSRIAKAKPSERILRPKCFPQTSTEKDFGFPIQNPELPGEYGKDRFVLMARDPNWLFGYWEITPALLMAKEILRSNDEEYTDVLRLMWQPRSLFDANFALLSVSLAASRSYWKVPFSGMSYRADLGWLGSKGTFISILISGECVLPEESEGATLPAGSSGINSGIS